MNKRKQSNKSEQGSYLVLGAFVMVALLIVTSLGVDLSRKYRLEQQAQDVADAAAMAGAAMLPDQAAAKQAAVRYILQHSGPDYVGAMDQDEDIQVSVTANNLSGTVGVIVYGSWDPIFMPGWLSGAENHGIGRYAIAVNKRQVTGFDDPSTGYAMFLGEPCASSMSGNSFQIIGDAHINNEITFSTNNQSNIIGTLEAGTSHGEENITITGGTDEPTAQITMPTLDQINQLRWPRYYDVRLDTTISNQSTYYSGAAVPIVVNPGGDGLYGTGDDQLLADVTGNNSIMAQYTDADGDGIPEWTMSTSNQSVTAANNSNIGTGVDVYIAGHASIELPNSNAGGSQSFWKGSFHSTHTMTIVNSNNSEVRATSLAEAVPGLDNHNLALASATSMPPGCNVTLSTNGNAVNAYGLVYTTGRLDWDGNMSNYNSGNEGTSGDFNTVGNGFIKGAIYAAAITNTKNNMKIYYDQILANQEPPRQSTPDVALVK